MGQNQSYRDPRSGFDRFLEIVPWMLFACISTASYLLEPFPSLFGDDFWSLREAQDLGLNPGGIGYFLQLRAVLSVGDSDWLVRLPSLVWSGVSLWALGRWLRLEPIPRHARLLILILWATNPFLWYYA